MEEEPYYDDLWDELLEDGLTEEELVERYMSIMMGRQPPPPQERAPLSEHLTLCGEQLIMAEDETSISPLDSLALLYGCCLLVLFTSYLTFLPKYFLPLTSVASGSYFLFVNFGQDVRVVFLLYAFATFAYVVIYSMQRRDMRKAYIGWRVGGTCFTLVIMIQALLPEKYFLRIRGVLMIMTMKLFSLGSDIETKGLNVLPGPIDFYSYCMDVSTVMFGPWVSYRQHARLMKQKKFEGVWKTLSKGFRAVLFSVACLMHSSCLLDWLIPDDYEFYSKWLVAFRDAMGFRFSHYFICFTGEAGVYLSGYLAQPIDNDDVEEIDNNEHEQQRKTSRRGQRPVPMGTVDGQVPPFKTTGPPVGQLDRRSGGKLPVEYYVTRPYHIELPRSLVAVVTNWNIPMHTWLKKYVFLPLTEDGNHFWAILITYGVSSLLHGFNFQISAVLLSLGIYTYAEHVLREKLSKAFDACIRAKSCGQDCGHANNRRNIYVVLFNFGFLLLSIFQLAYLGMVFDSSDEQEHGYNVAHTLTKWYQLGFAGHYSSLGLLIVAKVI